MNWDGTHVSGNLAANGIHIRLAPLAASQLSLALETSDALTEAIAAYPATFAGLVELKQALSFLLIERARTTHIELPENKAQMVTTLQSDVMSPKVARGAAEISPAGDGTSVVARSNTEEE
jgi:hypothetical protein